MSGFTYRHLKFFGRDQSKNSPRSVAIFESQKSLKWAFQNIVLFRSQVKKAQKVRRTWSEQQAKSQSAFPHNYWVIILTNKMIRRIHPPITLWASMRSKFRNVIENHSVIMLWWDILEGGYLSSALYCEYCRNKKSYTLKSHLQNTYLSWYEFQKCNAHFIGWVM